MDEYWLEIASPIGRLLLFGTNGSVTRVDLPANGDRPPGVPRPNAVLRRAEQQIAEYFAGRRRDFDLPIAPVGTDFQIRVWNALQTIPYGHTRSYSELAESVCNPQAARAVGSACAHNPLPIVIPCHRVVGADGRLTGFGGGLPVKKWLLEHESEHA